MISQSWEFVIYFDGIGTSIEKIWYRKSLRIGLKIFCYQKNLGIGLNNILYRKKVSEPVLIFNTAGALSGLGFSAGSIQSNPAQSTYSFLTVQGSSGQFQTVPTYPPTYLPTYLPTNSTQLNSTQLNLVFLGFSWLFLVFLGFSWFFLVFLGFSCFFFRLNLDPVLT